MHLNDQSASKVIPEQILKEFDRQLEEITFDCFEIAKISKGQEVSYLLIYLFDKYSLLADLKIPMAQFQQLALKIQNGYRDNLYHDRLHAFDVTQTVHFFLTKCKFEHVGRITSLERAAMYFAASVHDFDHP